MGHKYRLLIEGTVIIPPGKAVAIPLIPDGQKYAEIIDLGDIDEPE